jgi:hypothetical protein
MEYSICRLFDVQTFVLQILVLQILVSFIFNQHFEWREIVPGRHRSRISIIFISELVGFRCGLPEFRRLPRCHAAYVVFASTFQDYVSVPCSRTFVTFHIKL